MSIRKPDLTQKRKKKAWVGWSDFDAKLSDYFEWEEKYQSEELAMECTISKKRYEANDKKIRITVEEIK